MIAGGACSRVVLQAVSENLSVKQSIFASLAQELRPEAILASNTSSISITQIAASTIPKGVSAASEAAIATAGRVVGALLQFDLVGSNSLANRSSFLQSCASHGEDVSVFHRLPSR